MIVANEAAHPPASFLAMGNAHRKRSIGSVLFVLLVACSGVWAQHPPAAARDGLAPIRDYIRRGWDTLTRSMTSCDSIVDPKVAAPAVLYLPADFPVPSAVNKLEKNCKVDVKHLPVVIHGPGEVGPETISPPGLLFLENSYVVPGGRFNEMYGWDSYFIILGLVKDGRIDLAKDMVENFLFEIAHYGTILNANRSYYLSRSQPPFLTSMILAVYDAEKTAGHEDRAWLERAYKYAAKDYEMWARDPHLAGDTGLARYYDFGDTPAPESLKDETDHYRKVAAYFLNHPEQDRSYLVRRTVSTSGN